VSRPTTDLTGLQWKPFYILRADTCWRAAELLTPMPTPPPRAAAKAEHREMRLVPSPLHMLLEGLLAVPRAFDIQDPRVVKRARDRLRLRTSAADAASSMGARKWKIFSFHRDNLKILKNKISHACQ
jgi:hypothetical protein